MDEKFDVLVIGGGLAGLACACELAEAGLKVLVVEQRPYLGGRASSFPYKDGEIDIGQHVFLGCCTEYRRFLEKLGAWDEEKIHFQPSFRLEVWRDGLRGILRSAPLPAPLHLLPLLLFPHLCWGDKLRVLYGALCALWADRYSRECEAFYDWLKRHSQSEAAIQNFWNLITLPALNADVREASAHWGLMVFQEALLRPHGANLGYSRIGLSQLLDGIFPYLNERGGKVLLSQAAKSLLIEDAKIKGVLSASGGLLRAGCYVCAVTPDALLRLLPPFWRAHPFFAQVANLRWAPIVNVHLFYDMEVSPLDMVAFLGSHIQWVFSKGSGRHLCISLSGAWAYIDKDPKKLIELFSGELARLLPQARLARLEDAVVIKQRYATFLPAPQSERYRPSQRTPIEDLFLAGDWTKTGWPATMEGAVRSGRLCAQEILGGIHDSGAAGG